MVAVPPLSTTIRGGAQRSVVIDSPVNLQCDIAVGTMATSFMWTHNGTAIRQKDSRFTLTEGDAGAQLSFQANNKELSGDYVCTASNNRFIPMGDYEKIQTSVTSLPQALNIQGKINKAVKRKHNLCMRSKLA